VALPLLEETLKLSKANLGADHSVTLHSMNSLAVGYHAAGKLDLALPMLVETLQHRKDKLGADHPDTLISINNLAEGYRAAGKLNLALPLYEEAAAGIEKRRYLHEHAHLIIPSIVSALEAARQYPQAESWRRKWLAVVKERDGADSTTYASELAALARNLLRQEHWSEAETALTECLAIRQSKQPDAWTTFNSQSLLGGALLGQKKYADAEPHLLSGYVGMKERERTIPPQGAIRLHEALDRLIELYAATDKPDEVTKWRAKYPQSKPE
jgi:tetratricopeptide (TPR) repeat protein